MFDWNQFYIIAEKLSRLAISEPGLSEAYYRIAISRIYYSVAIQTRDKLINFGFKFPKENTHTLVKTRVANNFVSREKNKRILWRIAKDNLITLCERREEADYNSDKNGEAASHYSYAVAEADSVLEFLEIVSGEDFNISF
jgi:uncharacterized protein (UPF0332 family)